MIKNIIFDLGGVILEVDTGRAVTSFKDLGIKNFETLYSLQKQTHLFDNFEMGIVSPDEFRSIIRVMSPSLTDVQIDAAWSSMIGETPTGRMNFLKRLSSRYNLYLLSNTNEIHIRFFTKYYDDTYGENYFSSLFKNIYFSCRLGMRKPDKAIFDFVAMQNNLALNETLFIDDSPQHIAAASDAGMHAILLPAGKKIESFLDNELTILDL